MNPFDRYKKKTKKNDKIHKKSIDKQNEKVEKIGKSLNLKFEVPKLVKLYHDEFNKDEESVLKNLPYYLLGLSTLILKHRNIINDIIKIYKNELSKDTTSDFGVKIYKSIIIFLEKLYEVKSSDPLEFIATAVTLISILFKQIPNIFTKVNQFNHLSILDLANSLSTSLNNIKNIFYKIPLEEEERTKAEKNFIDKINKLEKKMEQFNLEEEIISSGSSSPKEYIFPKKYKLPKKTTSKKSKVYKK